MKTYLDCIPCFFNQALRAARIAGANKKTQKKVVDKVAQALPEFSLASCPSEMGRILYRIVREVTGVNDPYKKIKKDSNKLAALFYNTSIKKVNGSKDRLLTAVELAVAGNIIDYGARKVLNMRKELEKTLALEHKIIRKENKAVFDYKEFKSFINRAEKVLYLGDNAGEIIFDKILLKEIKRYGKAKQIIFAVREEPIINDALLKDAFDCGIDKVAKVISSGVDAPGTILSLCTKNFLKIFNEADLIISKGQGNFEALSGDKEAGRRPIFFLFVTKCAVSARHIGCGVGDIVLAHNFRKIKS